MTPELRSRLPEVGTTIFTVMSALATEHDAVNLGQGFPDFDCDPALIEAVHQAMLAGLNQYPPMVGVAALRQVIADKTAQVQGVTLDPVQEITITAGATQALLTSILALVHPGDEVVVLEPCYDSYRPAIALAGGHCVTVPLSAHGQRPDFDQLASALTPKTRLLIVNTPHNPTGATWSREQWEQLRDLLAPSPTLLLSDEVYEHMVYDQRPHHSALSVEGLRDRAVVVSSFGKTLHVTGWKLGYAIAPAPLTTEFRKVHQFNVFTANTPMQHGLASYLSSHPEAYLNLSAFYQQKRDLFRAGLHAAGFELLPCEGSYFQCVRHPSISAMGDAAFCRWLTTEIGVAAIPLSAFLRPNGVSSDVVRFCFAKKDDTLRLALDRLASIR